MKSKTAIIATVLVALTFLSGSRACAQDRAAQTVPIDEDIKLFRQDLRSLKKQIVALNMDLSESEALQFWPIYDRYTKELTAITNSKYALLKDYAQNYDSITGEQAESYIKGRADVEESITKLRLRYFPIFRKILSGQATARFFQIDWRLGLIMDLQLMSETPLIDPQ